MCTTFMRIGFTTALACIVPIVPTADMAGDAVAPFPESTGSGMGHMMIEPWHSVQLGDCEERIPEGVGSVLRERAVDREM